MRLPDRLNSRAVLIGTATYRDEHLPDLPAVRDTVKDLAAILTDARNGILSNANCRLLLDETDLSKIGRRWGLQPTRLKISSWCTTLATD